MAERCREDYVKVSDEGGGVWTFCATCPHAEPPLASRTRCCADCLTPLVLGKRACQTCGSLEIKWIGSPECACTEIPGCPACNSRMRTPPEGRGGT